MGVVGDADVLAVEPCPEIESGPGRVVTGTFRHAGGQAYDLKLEGEPAPLGVTSTHPFWSVDRQDWIPAEELREGETLQTLTGPTRVQSFKKRPGLETVYNLEIEGDHCYRVGQTGVLVHNASMLPSRGIPPRGLIRQVNCTPALAFTGRDLIEREA